MMHHIAVELCSSATSYTIQRRLMQTPRFKTWVQSLSQLVLGCCVGVLNICCGCTEHLLWVYSAFVVGVPSIFCGCTEHLLWVAFETMSMSAATGSNYACATKHFAGWLLCYLGMSEHAWTHITLGASYLGCMCTEPIGANRVYYVSRKVMTAFRCILAVTSIHRANYDYLLNRPPWAEN